MKLYNTLTQKVEEFREWEKGKVSIYTCGPTVYHFAHIGNLRSYVEEDVLVKTMEYLGYQVKRAMNITDVGHLSSDADTGEDKMVAGAKREHKTVLEIAKFYTDAFFSDYDKLNMKRPDVLQPATGCISDFIEMIGKLLEKGYAYRAGENIYFDTSKLDSYYVFGNQSEDDLMVGVREDVSEDANKKNKNDFVLWFTKSKFEDQALKWESPFGTGYPGWHIECSSISIHSLGEHLDIHCGGVDNIFPHHTNEIAQSESYLGHKWCNYWFHVQHLNDQNGKMSKSKGNILTVSVLEEQGYDPIAYRMYLLESHYRKPLAFSFEMLSNTQNAYRKMKKKIADIQKNKGDGFSKEDFDRYQKEFKEALENDLNTAMALTVLYDVLKVGISNDTKLKLIEDFDRVLSLNLLKEAETKMKESGISAEEMEEIEEAIQRRKEAKRNKDFALADSIRDELAKKNIILKDTREGTTWEKV